MGQNRKRRLSSQKMKDRQCMKRQQVMQVPAELSYTSAGASPTLSSEVTKSDDKGEESISNS